VAGTSPLRRNASDRSVLRSVHNVAYTVRCGYSRLPVSRVQPASEHCVPVAVLGCRGPPGLRVRLRAAQGVHNSPTLRAVAEQDAANLTNRL